VVVVEEDDIRVQITHQIHDVPRRLGYLLGRYERQLNVGFLDPI